MRPLVGIALACSVLLSGRAVAFATCGDDRGDAVAVLAIESAVATQCDCCAPRVSKAVETCSHILQERKVAMPTYVTLIRFTQKGIEAIKDGPARLDAAKQAYRAVGAHIKDFYLVTGKYDALVVSDVPDEATAAKLSLAIASNGYSRTETVRAFTEEEYRTIVSQLPKVNIK